MRTCQRFEGDSWIHLTKRMAVHNLFLVSCGSDTQVENHFVAPIVVTLEREDHMDFTFLCFIGSYEASRGLCIFLISLMVQRCNVNLIISMNEKMI